MTRPIVFVLYLFGLLLAACTPANKPTAPQASIHLEDCTVQVRDEFQIRARCGVLTVPEDRANPDGRQIGLQITVLPAIARASQPDPLFLLAGGPGQSAHEAFQLGLMALTVIRQDRDIILVDQRGTGGSNPLVCLDPEERTLSDDEVVARLKACPALLDADLRFYTTEIAMQDLDEVRAALGYPTVNLYGVSYGTRAALTYLRMFPERVRTVTLDAVVDADFVISMDVAQDGQAALESFFARCASDQACNSTFPNLEDKFTVLLERLEQHSYELNMSHPLTNHPMQVTVTPDLLTRLVFRTLYVPDLVATLPLAIHEAYVNENYIPLVSQPYMTDARIYDGMHYAVMCSEDAPLIDPELAAEHSFGTVFDDRAADYLSICAGWPRAEVSSEFRQPVRSTVPILILSGEADPITPPHHALSAAEYLHNSLHLVFADMGHGNLFNRCSLQIFADFIEAGALDALDTACHSSIVPPPFFVDFSGPRP